MKPLIQIDLLRLMAGTSPTPDAPRRKSLPVTAPSAAFIKPMRQSVMRNPRLSPGTRCMLAMLMGWAGQEQALETTIGIIARHLGRSRSQVQRYLKDAIEEGYLFYSRTKDRIGYYTGIKVHLNFAALRPRYKKKMRPQPKQLRDVSYPTDTNSKYIYKRDNTDDEQSYMDSLQVILDRNGIG